MTRPTVDNLKTMLAYQDRAIVSSMLLRNPGGSVTLFAFDGDQGLSEHTAPHDALVVAVEGRAAITVGGERCSVAEGEALVLPADVPHAVEPDGPFKMLLVMIKATT